MKRIVPIIVTDDRVTHLYVQHQADDMLSPDARWPDAVMEGRVPVPSGDQLHDALRHVCDLAESWAWETETRDDDIAIVRAAFHLDEGEQ